MTYGGETSGTSVTLVDIARSRRRERPQAIVFTFLDSNLAESAVTTYETLDETALRVAAHLQRDGAVGDRVVLACANGPDFVGAFFGCLYAGRVAVPVQPPEGTKPAQWRPIENILCDSTAEVVLTDGARVARIEAWLAQARLPRAVRVVALDEAIRDPGACKIPPSDPCAPALLQYTSGSTNAPKGVVVTHGNLCANAALIKECFRVDEDSTTVSWLPHYHNMGLVGYMANTFYAGARSVMMAPDTFLTKPVRWLEAISRYRAIRSAGPNFAFDLCTRTVTDADMASLDLSSWETACLGGEPIRHATLEAFARKFGACGFREEAFCPCYGLSEATLIVTTAGRGRPAVARAFELDALSRNRVKTIDAASAVPAAQSGSRYLIGVGPLATGQKVAIVNPATSERCGADEIGEVWITGPSVAAGYWRRPAESEQAFAARIAGEAGGPYVRTGDLGFVQDGELFIAGRLKDLIIIRGRNHYPQDIEATVQDGDPACRGGAGTAFSIEGDDEERLVVVQEVATPPAFSDEGVVLENIRQAIVEQHEIQPHAVVLIRSGSLPKTPSGKVQRRLTRELYMNGDLDVVARWTADQAGSSQVVVLESEVEKRVAAIWAEILNLRSDGIGANANFLLLGGDSLKAKVMLGRLQEHFAVELALRDLFESPTIAHIARLIELHLNAGAAPPAGSLVELEDGML